MDLGKCRCSKCRNEDPEPLKPDPPPLSRREVDQERCCECESQALLLPGYCSECGAVV
jgi:hypothetical protein